MLKIFYGDMPEAIYNTSMYFRNTYQDEWIVSDFARKIIKGIDKSEVLDGNAIKSPVLGIIPPVQLSGGTKALLLIANCPDEVFNASNCGDNCAKYLLQLGKKHDVTINLRHIMDFGKKPFTVMVLNNGMEAHNMDELLFMASEWV